MKILKTVTGNVRKVAHPTPNEKNGKICEYCRRKVIYGKEPMFKVSARIHAHLTSTYYFCIDCKNKDAKVIVQDAHETRLANMRKMR